MRNTQRNRQATTKPEKLSDVCLPDTPTSLCFVGRERDEPPLPPCEPLSFNPHHGGRSVNRQQLELTPAKERKVARAIQRVIDHGEWAELIFPDGQKWEMFVYPTAELEREIKELDDPILSEALLSGLPMSRRLPKGQALAR
jgi:hypothetical protein